MGPVHRALLLAAAVTLLAHPRGRPPLHLRALDPASVEVVLRGRPTGLWPWPEARRRVAAACQEATRGLPVQPAAGQGERWEVVEVGRTCRLVRRLLPGRRLVALGLPVDLNRASARDLAAIPGLGPATARRLVALRER